MWTTCGQQAVAVHFLWHGIPTETKEEDKRNEVEKAERLDGVRSREREKGAKKGRRSGRSRDK